MKKVLSLIFALFVTVAFAGVTLAADIDKEMKPTPMDNTMMSPGGGMMGQQPMGQQPMMQQPMGQQPMGQQPMGQQPMGQQPMEKKY